MGCIYPLNQKEAFIKVKNVKENKISDKAQILNMYLSVVNEAIYSASELGFYSCTVYIPFDYYEMILDILYDRDFIFTYNAKFSLLNISWDKSNKD